MAVQQDSSHPKLGNRRTDRLTNKTRNISKSIFRINFVICNTGKADTVTREGKVKPYTGIERRQEMRHMSEEIHGSTFKTFRRHDRNEV